MTPLPLDCEAAFCPDFLGADEAAELFAELLADYSVTAPSQFGGLPVFMFGDPVCITAAALPEVWGGRAEWPASLAAVRDRIAEETGIRFEVARTVYYHDGQAKMGFHSDLPAYGCTKNIASLSLGAEREFVLRRGDSPEDRLSVQLTPGSLVFMGPGTQQRYEHGLLPDPNCHEPRLNLTFRRFGFA
ncbi:MAG: hypothetical protein ACI8W8_003329 [Rhodothermales bacterium]|jgi:hypothetical protein